MVLAVSLGVMQGAKADVTTFAEAAVPRLSQYLKIDTVNPPGNEYRGVAYLSKLLDDAGVVYESAESAKGRGNLWARLEGAPGPDGKKKPALVLLHHIAVSYTHLTLPTTPYV